MARMWSRRRVLGAGAAAAAGGAAVAMTAGPGWAAPPGADDLCLVTRVDGDRVDVQRGVAPAAAAPVAAGVLAEDLGKGWSLRPGDLVELRRADGGLTAVPVHRQVYGAVQRSRPDHLVVQGQRLALGPWSRTSRGAAAGGVAVAARPRVGETVAVECLDNRVDGTLTVHFLRVETRA